MTAKLIEPGSGAERTRETPLTGEEFVIGRGVDCNLRVPLESISRHHCMIRIQSDEFTLMDLGSSNGTYLNGQRVRSPRTLHTGDEIRIDACRFIVDLGDQPGADVLGKAGADPGATTQKVRADTPYRTQT